MRRSFLPPAFMTVVMGVCAPANAQHQYQDPYEFHSVLPTDCDEVRGMMNLENQKMEYFYINTCNRAHFWTFYRLRGAVKVRETVLYVPSQVFKNQSGVAMPISGYFCSKYPDFKKSRVWSCQRSGWVPRN
jgi:hypothetical protein